MAHRVTSQLDPSPASRLLTLYIRGARPHRIAWHFPDPPCALPPPMCSPRAPRAFGAGCFLTVGGYPYIVAAYSTRGPQHPHVLTIKTVCRHAQYPLGSKTAPGPSIITSFFFFLRRMGSWTLVCLASYSSLMPPLQRHLSRDAVRSCPGKGRDMLSPLAPTPYRFAPPLVRLLRQRVGSFVAPTAPPNPTMRLALPEKQHHDSAIYGHPRSSAIDIISASPDTSLTAVVTVAILER